jgi:hypothetical protein
MMQPFEWKVFVYSQDWQTNIKVMEWARNIPWKIVVWHVQVGDSSNVGQWSEKGTKTSIKLIMANVSAINICGIGYCRNFIKVFPVHVNELFKYPSLQRTTSPKASYLYNQQ